MNKDTDPDKYAKLQEEYFTNLKKFMTAHPSTISGMELELVAVSPKLKWDKLQVDHREKLPSSRRIPLNQNTWQVKRIRTLTDVRQSRDSSRAITGLARSAWMPPPETGTCTGM